MLQHQIMNGHHDEWVVFVHGIGGSTNTWKKQIDLFAEKYNLLLLDLPGHGQDSKNIIRKVNTKQLNADIVDTLDYLGIESAHFVGLSLGTIVIANFAVQNPSRVNSIILGGSALDICGIYRMCVGFANSIKRAVPYKFLYKFFAWFMMPRRNHKKSRTIFLREVVKLNKTTMFAWIQYLRDSMKNVELFSRLDKLGKKILFISGSEDHCFLKGSKILAKQIKMANLQIIERCGHICSIEKSVIFNNYALNYLAAS